MRRPFRIRGAAPLFVLATLLGLAVIGVALASLASPGGSTAGQTSGGSSQRSGMAGMVMLPAAPAVPKLASGSPCTRRACPIAKPSDDELSVAARLGSAMAAAWVTRDRGRIRARLELLNADLGPIDEPVSFAGHPERRACGPGCWQLTLPTDQGQLRISAREAGRRHTAILPLRWVRGQSGRARALVNRAVQTMSALIGLRLDEQLATGTPGSPGSFDDIHFVLSAPNAMSASVTGQPERQVTIGPSQWTYTPGVGWLRGSYNGTEGTTFRTASMFSWYRDEQSAQLLGESTRGSEQVAEVALMNPHVPAWIRLTIQTRTGLVTQAKLVTDGKFTTDDFSDYGSAERIVPPKS